MPIWTSPDRQQAGPDVFSGQARSELRPGPTPTFAVPLTLTGSIPRTKGREMAVVVEKLDTPTVRRTSGDRYGPSIRCDACGTEIPKPAKGRVAWDPDENRTYLSAVFLHQGCVAAYRGEQETTVRTADLADFVESLERFAAGSER